LEIGLCEFGAPGTHAEIDVLLSISVKVGAYSAADQAWIVSDVFHSFLEQLQTLESNRKGRAVLDGASPDDLRLEFYSTDSSGHMAVKGHLGWRTVEQHHQQLQFGFDFEPDRLPSLVQSFKRFSGLP
jgi:hypothetical protein